MPAVSASAVTKQYRLYQRPRHRLIEMLTGRPMHRDIVALQDVSFTVEPGECFGIIGENGAGKSTLLKILAGISVPTAGSVEIGGRVSALLELNSGFHSEFTGRENLHLNAAIIGLGKEEILEREPEIVEFAGLGEFIDLPVRTYSSGMYLRLGFAIATAVNPDVLLIDEALAVGDESFRGKCIRRIEEFRNSGKTILVVSHDLSMIRGLCHRAVLLDKGRAASCGPAGEVIDHYLDRIYQRAAEQMRDYHGTLTPEQKHRGGGEVEITAVRLLNAEGRPSTVFRTGQAMHVEFDFQAHQDCPEPLLGVNIFRSDGILAICTNQVCSNYTNRTLRAGQPAGDCPEIIKAGQKGTARFTIESNQLMEGRYELGVNIFRGKVGAHMPVDEVLGAVRFQMLSGRFQDRGLMLCPGTWSIRN